MECIEEYQILCDRLRHLRLPSLIGIDGFTGSGKSTLADSLGEDLGALVIHLDNYVVGEDESLSYPDRLDYIRMRGCIHTSTAPALTIVEGICLREVLRRSNLSADFFVYIKRIGTNRLWYDGFHLEEFDEGHGIDENNEEPHRSDFAYHAAVHPHELADVIFLRTES